jgi:diguanylate cyclase (GGDEF)-like protein
VARLGGDEFVLLLGDLASPDDAHQIMQRCLASVGQPIRLQGGATARVGASMGIALNAAGEGAAQLLQRADEAMYAAKRAGKGRIVVSGQ